MAPAKPIHGKLGAGCLVLFALPFAGVGLFAAFQAIKLLLAHDWKQGPIAAAFAFAFGSAGFGLIAFVIFGSKRGRQRATLEARHPNEPWFWREDWARGEVKSAGAPTLIFIWFFALLWNAISSAVFFGVLSQGDHGNAIYLGLIFPLVGLGLLMWAIRQTLRWRRFGESIFKMTTLPGVIGGPLAGVIRPAQPLQRAKEIQLRLACFKRDSSGETTSEEMQWEDEKLFSSAVLQSGEGIPVLFNIPFECPPTAILSANLTIVWRLEAMQRSSKCRFSKLRRAVPTRRHWLIQRRHTKSESKKHSHRASPSNPPFKVALNLFSLPHATRTSRGDWSFSPPSGPARL